MYDSRHRSSVRRKTYIVAPLVLLGSALASGTIFGASPAAVNVRGKLTGWDKLVPQVYAEAAADPHRYTWREPSPTVKTEFRRLSANVSRDVCVVATSAAQAQAHEPLAVKLTGGRLTPSTLVLSPGSRLSFKNGDPFSHVLYEVGNDKWAANTTASGSNREWAATTPGLHVIRDQLFPSIAMYVTVDASAVEFATPDHDGAFSMAVTPGDYTVKIFFEGKQVGKSADPVHVGPGGLDLSTLALAGGAGGESK
jgi:plastocyanin